MVRFAAPCLFSLALLTSVASAQNVSEPTSEQPRRDYYVGASLVGPANGFEKTAEMSTETENDYSVEGGVRIGSSHVWGHAEASTGVIAANAGLELRLCSRGTFFVCGTSGIDAAYTQGGVEPLTRFGFELGTALRLRMEADVPMKRTSEMTYAAHDTQFKLGVAYVF